VGGNLNESVLVNLQKQAVQYSTSQVWSVEHWLYGMLIAAKWANGFHGQMSLEMGQMKLNISLI